MKSEKPATMGQLTARIAHDAGSDGARGYDLMAHTIHASHSMLSARPVASLLCRRALA